MFEVNYSGMELVTDDAFQRVIIDDVYAGSPAHEAWLKIGYEIVQINGVRTSDLQLPQIRSMLNQDGKEVKMQIDRKGELHSYLFRLQPLTE
jgi:C-terminal processing protease CtpA/Prc